MIVSSYDIYKMEFNLFYQNENQLRFVLVGVSEHIQPSGTWSFIIEKNNTLKNLAKDWYAKASQLGASYNTSVKKAEQNYWPMLFMAGQGIEYTIFRYTSPNEERSTCEIRLWNPGSDRNRSKLIVSSI